MTSEHSANRVRKFLKELSRMKGVDQEEILTLNSGHETREATLTVSDLKSILGDLSRENGPYN